MGRERKQPEPEQQAGAPEWMVTFSDCMTLLLTFFVLLLSFSSFDDEDNFRKMNSSFAAQFSFGKDGRTEEDSMADSPRLTEDIYWGSEKPTLKEGLDNRFKEQTEPPDYLKFNTFLISSDEIFWGKGSVLSRRGKKMLEDLSLFLNELPFYFVIISESGPPGENGSAGYERAWAVFDYLNRQKNIPQERLNLSAVGSAVQEYHASQLERGFSAADTRMLEIVLLKRSY